VGRVVHYVSYGTPKGEFTSQCRAATVTEVDPADPDRIGLCAINPTGLFFHPLVAGGCRYDEGGSSGGSWHWPERVDD
jgi:hypothetical protein